MSESFAERFWSKVDKSRGPLECWLWTAAKYSFGHGCFNVGHRNEGAHRVAYELTHGPIPGCLFVLHGCNNASCVNPAHLRVGTQKDNMADRDAANRHGLHLHPERAATGERNGSCKLADAEVRNVHRLSQQGLRQRDIAQICGVGQAQVCRILRGDRRRSIWLEFNSEGDKQ